MSTWQTYLERVAQALGRAPAVALLGPRQCGKTILARQASKVCGALLRIV